MLQDQLDLLPPDFLVGSRLGFPQDFLPDTEIATLVRREVPGDQLPVGTTEIEQRAGQIHSDVDLPVRIGNLVDNFHGPRGIHFAGQKTSAADSQPPQFLNVESGSSGVHDVELPRSVCAVACGVAFHGLATAREYF